MRVPSAGTIDERPARRIVGFERKRKLCIRTNSGLFFAACGDFVASRLWDRRRFFGVMPTSLFSTAPATSVHFALPFFCDLLNGITPPPRGPGPGTRARIGEPIFVWCYRGPLNLNLYVSSSISQNPVILATVLSSSCVVIGSK